MTEMVLSGLMRGCWRRSDGPLEGDTHPKGEIRPGLARPVRHRASVLLYRSIGLPRRLSGGSAGSAEEREKIDGDVDGDVHRRGDEREGHERRVVLVFHRGHRVEAEAR